MEKLRRLNRYQKFIVLLMIAVILIFTVFYATTISRVGFRYQDSIFVPSHETGSTVYSGKLRGTQASFTVSEDQTVVFRYGDKTYDTYTVKEDPSAVPKNTELSEDLTGIELLCGDDILFRGGFLRGGDPFLLYNENGDLELFNLSYTSGNGTELAGRYISWAVLPVAAVVCFVLGLQ